MAVNTFSPDEIAQFHNNYAQAQARQQAQKKPTPSGNFLTHLFPTIGGIAGGAGGGALGGALAGTAVLPGIGTAAGGLLGALIGGGAGGALGKAAENKEEGQKLTSGVGGQAVEQGLLSAGPLRLLKGAKVATAAAKEGGGLLDALNAGGEAATAPGVIQKALGSTAKKMYAQTFTVPRRLASSVKPEQTAKELMDYGIGGSLDKIDDTSRQVLGTLGKHFDNAVSGVNGQVKVGELTGVAKDALKGVNATKSAKQALFDRITDIGSNGKLPGYANPSEIIEKARELEGRGFNYINAGEGGLVKNPDTADLGRAYVQVAKEMEDHLFGAMGKSDSLKAVQTPEAQTALNKLAKGLGDKFTSAKSPEEVRSLMAPFVRAKNAVQLTRDESQAAGTTALSSLSSRLGAGGGGALLGGSVVPGVGHAVGAVGGFLGAPLLRGIDETARAPLSTGGGRLLSKVAGDVGNAGVGATDIAKRVAPVGLLQALAGSQQSQGLSASAANTSPNTQTMNANQFQDMPQLSQNQGDMSSSSPFDPSNVETNIEKIVAAGGSMDDVSKYLSIASTVNSLQAKANPSSQLTSTQATQLASNANALDTVQQLQQLYGAAGGGGGKISGNIKDLMAKVGLNNPTEAYNALAESSVSQLAKALNGSGQVSDADASAIVKALPLITDSPQVAQTKFAAIMQRLQSAQQNGMSLSSGGDANSLLSALGGAQ